MWSLEDSHCRGAPHLNRITLPALVVQSDADTGVFPGDAQAIYDALGSDGQTPGDDSSGTTICRRPADARDGVADMLADWLRSRGA